MASTENRCSLEQEAEADEEEATWKGGLYSFTFTNGSVAILMSSNELAKDRPALSECPGSGRLRGRLWSNREDYLFSGQVEQRQHDQQRQQ
jgi:hypothetical protein